MLNKMFEMRVLMSFPMEKLCYDLKLEMFEQMEPNDIIELVKVDSGFRSILLRKPWIVFGHHVHIIACLEECKILKSFEKRHYFENFVRLDADLHIPLIKRIYSCKELTLRMNDKLREHKLLLLNQLRSIKGLFIMGKSGELLLKFLENFRTRIEEYASIWMEIDFLNESQMISEPFRNFILNKIHDLKAVKFEGHSGDLFHLYYNAFVKTSIEFLEISAEMTHFEEIVQSIVKKGIPSKNVKAAFYVHTRYSRELGARIVDFLSNSPGMKRLDVENQREVSKMANELFDKRCSFFPVYQEPDTYFMKGLAFRRNIESSRDCVYILDRGLMQCTAFFAFYLSSCDF